MEWHETEKFLKPAFPLDVVLALGLFEHLGAGLVWGKLRLHHSLHHPPA
ncbi:hypothetical protein [Streptomyces sp. NPDC056713]